jgi:hypothetical protein
MSPGIFPYLGGSITADHLQTIPVTYGGAVVPRKRGVRMAAKTRGVLADPALYDPRVASGSDALFDYDEWLIRQQAAATSSEMVYEMATSRPISI